MAQLQIAIVPTAVDVSESCFCFTIAKFSEIKEEVLSPPVFVRHLPWQIMIRPEQVESNEMRTLGFYLFCNKDIKSNSWACNATVELRLLASELKKPIRRKFKHLFCTNACSEGFPDFEKWSEILNAENGFIKDDKIIVEVHLSADEPKGVAWNSRKHTGFVGFKNQSGNSYMNSILQILLCANDFCNAICEKPAEFDKRSLHFALQNLFQSLQLSDVPVTIDAFTDFIETDAHDLINEYETSDFFKTFQAKIKSDNQLNPMLQMFEGKISILTAYTERYTVIDSESFSGIIFKIQGHMNIYDYFDDYIASKALQHNIDTDLSILRLLSPRTNASNLLNRLLCLFGWGANEEQTNWNSDIVKNSKKTAEFATLPPVLILHLDQNRNSADIDKSFEFLEQINLKKYCRKPVDTPTNYILHSVLVQSDDEYVAFINLHKIGRWLKFDNDIVSHCTKEQAINENYGKARMLVYVHVSSINMEENTLKFTCPICMEIIKNAEKISTMCGHLFCGPCIDQEIKIRQKCPTCKQDLAANQIHPIYC